MSNLQKKFCSLESEHLVPSAKTDTKAINLYCQQALVLDLSAHLEKNTTIPQYINLFSYHNYKLMVKSKAFLLHSSGHLPV